MWKIFYKEREIRLSGVNIISESPHVEKIIIIKDELVKKIRKDAWHKKGEGDIINVWVGELTIRRNSSTFANFIFLFQ